MRILLDPTAGLGGTPAAPVAPVAPVAPANPHPAAVQPPPAQAAAVPNPLAPPAAPTINYNIAAPAQPQAPAAQPQAAAPPIPGVPTATTQQTVTIPLEQLQTFTSIQARLAQMEAERETQRQAAQQEQARLMAQRGEVENALTLLRSETQTQLQAERERAAAIERDAARYALDGELSRALAAHNLVPGGADQLATLWRGNFNAARENGTFAVRTPTFETPAQFVQRELANPAYAHFLRAANPTGGTAAGQPTQAAPTPPANPTPAPQPANMGEAVILHMQGLKQAQGDARYNAGLPMGLKAVR